MWAYVIMIRFRDAGYKTFLCIEFNPTPTTQHCRNIYIAREYDVDSSGNMIWYKACDGGKANSADTLTDWGTRTVTNANDAPFGFCAALDCENAPNPFWSTILTTGSSSATKYKTQIAFPWAFGVGENKIRYRCENNGEWGSWQEISTTPIKSTTFSVSVVNDKGYAWTGITFPRYIVGVDMGQFDTIVQFCKGNHVDAGKAEWIMMFFNRLDVTTPLKGSFSGVIYYIDV